MIKHRPVEAFREVMRSGSISAAAENLEISQPAVSRLIRDLEAEIGFALFTRHGSRIVATAAAHEFIEVVERSFTGLNYIHQSAQRIRSGRNTGLSVAAAPVFASTLLVDALCEMANAGVLADAGAVHITTLPVVRQVSLRRSEIGVNILSHHQQDVDLVRNYPLSYYVIMTRGHRHAARQVLEPADLAGEDYVAFDEATVSGQMQNRLFAGMQNGPRIVIRSYLANVISAFVLRGLGLSIVDPFTARQHVAAGGCCARLSTAEDYRVSVIKPLGAKISPLGESLIAAIDRQVDRLAIEPALL